MTRVRPSAHHLLARLPLRCVWRPLLYREQTNDQYRVFLLPLANLEELARKYNPILRGWWNYYGSFYKTEMRKLYDYLNQRLVIWSRRKYRKLKCHKRRSFQWLLRVADKQPWMFYHWKMVRNSDWIMGAVWCESITYGSARGLRWNSSCLLSYLNWKLSSWPLKACVCHNQPYNDLLCRLTEINAT